MTEAATVPLEAAPPPARRTPEQQRTLGRVGPAGLVAGRNDAALLPAALSVAAALLVTALRPTGGAA